MAWLSQQLREPLGSLATQFTEQLSANGIDIKRASSALMPGQQQAADGAADSRVAELQAEVARLRGALEDLDQSHQAEMVALAAQFKAKQTHAPGSEVPPTAASVQELLVQALAAEGAQLHPLPPPSSAAPGRADLVALLRGALRALHADADEGLAQRLSDALDAADALRKERDQLVARVTDTDQTLQRLAREKSDALERLQAEMERAAPQTARATERNEELQLAHSTLATLQEEFAQMRHELALVRAENEGLKSNKARLTADLEKRGLDLERLRAHIIQQEDQRTAELLQLDAHIKDLKRQLDEQAARHAAELVARPQAAAAEALAELQRRLDETTARLGQTEAINENLEAAVEQITTENQVSFASMEKRLQQRIDELTAQLQVRDEQIGGLQGQIETLQRDAGSVVFLRQNLHIKEQAVERLEGEVAKLQGHLVESLHRLNSATRDTSSDHVDRTLISNLVINLMSARDARTKSDVLGVLANVLSLSPEQRRGIGLDLPRRSFFGSLLGFGAQQDAQAGKPSASRDARENFSELWVQFLLSEARANEMPPQDAQPAETVRTL